MNIHEYQAKDILQQHGIAVPKGFPALTIAELEEGIKKLQSHGSKRFAVKAQIHAGGRGKAGGVKLVNSIAEAKQYAEKMLGSKLITHQTGPQGQEVRRLYVEAATNISKEYYLSFVLDRTQACVTIIASAQGGVNIEEVAASNPEQIVKISIDPVLGYKSFHGRRLSSALSIDQTKFKKLDHLLAHLYKVFMSTEATQIEINPLAETNEGELICLDAKLNFDDNALQRHPELLALRDFNEEESLEIEASKYELSYIKMDGEIGCMVNGAGLAMATMDIIKLYNKEPANFLDVGGGANKEKVSAAFRIILSDPNVRAVLVNIFGGIMKCDIIAEGIVEAAKTIELKVPLVVRLEGTNVELGKKILNSSKLNIITANDLDDAAKKVVQAIA